MLINSAHLTKFGIYGLLISPFFYPKLLPVFTFFLLIVWVREGNWREKIDFYKSNLYFLALPALYLCYVIGMFYTTNLNHGFQKLEVRLVLLVLPLVLPTLQNANWSQKKRSYMSVFVLAATCGVLFSFSRAFALYFLETIQSVSSDLLEKQGYKYFFSSHLFGFVMHPGYYVMFVIMAFFVALNLLFQATKSKLRMFLFLSLPILLVAVFLSYSKAGLLAFILIAAVFTFYLAFSYKKLHYILYLILGVALILGAYYFFVPHSQERFETLLAVNKAQNLDPTSIESTQARIHAWKAARISIKQSLFFGHGTGDANDVLFKQYKELNYTGVLQMELNAHSEYYQTALAIGLLGLSVLCLTFIVAIRSAYLKRNWLLAAWVLATLLVFSFESYLNTLAGSCFLALFFTLLPLIHSNPQGVMD
jgi:O-antigen ligase